MTAVPAAPRRRPWRTTLIVLAVVAALIIGVVGWRAVATRPQGRPIAVEITEATLSPALTDATVLALGEATHGNAEFQRLRLQLLQLAPQFRAVAWEEDYGSVALVDDWVQGGPGTAEEAARRFGFRLTHTTQTVELLQWIRDHNASLPSEQRIRLVGIDVQRVQANKELALSALDRVDTARAATLRTALEPWNDETRGDAAAQQAVAPAVDRLIAALAEVEGRDGQRARNAATTLRQQLDLQAAPNYARTRAAIMADNLERTVAEEAERGNEHTLLFAHNGHVDKTSAAYGHDDLGTLAAATWGERYRVVGTEFHHSRLGTGERERRWQVDVDHPTPLRGAYAGTTVGWVDLTGLTGEDAELFGRPVRMGSAGESFQQWQAWIPWLNSVEMVPTDSYDALVLVERATPVTYLG